MAFCSSRHRDKSIAATIIILIHARHHHIAISRFSFCFVLFCFIVATTCQTCQRPQKASSDFWPSQDLKDFRSPPANFPVSKAPESRIDPCFVSSSPPLHLSIGPLPSRFLTTIISPFVSLLSFCPLPLSFPATGTGIPILFLLTAQFIHLAILYESETLLHSFH